MKFKVDAVFAEKNQNYLTDTVTTSSLSQNWRFKLKPKQNFLTKNLKREIIFNKILF